MMNSTQNKVAMVCATLVMGGMVCDMHAMRFLNLRTAKQAVIQPATYRVIAEKSAVAIKNQAYKSAMNLLPLLRQPKVLGAGVLAAVAVAFAIDMKKNPYHREILVGALNAIKTGIQTKATQAGIYLAGKASAFKTGAQEGLTNGLTSLQSLSAKAAGKIAEVSGNVRSSASIYFARLTGLCRVLMHKSVPVDRDALLLNSDLGEQRSIAAEINS